MVVHKIIPLRERRKTLTAAYIRVSTKKEEQDGSFEEQKKYYEKLIRSNPDWEFAGLYCERISGTHMEDRPVFRQMVQDAIDAKVDLILCKSLSRWARNTVDALETIQILKSQGVRILFEEDNIDTSECGMIMRVAMGSAIAQQESRSISENIKWTYRKRAEYGIFVPSKRRYFGYNTDDGRFIPDENAKYVRMMFEWYAEGKDAQAIADELKARGVFTVSGSPFTRSAVRRILENEIYVGDIWIGKTPSVDVITGAKDKEQYEQYIENHHIGIIDRELWKEVQRIHEGHKEVLSKRKHERMCILQLIKDEHTITADKISAKLEMDVTQVRYHIRELRKSGLISREGSSRNGVWVVIERQT